VYPHGQRSAAEIAGELTILTALAAAGAPVSYPIRARDGSNHLCVNAAEGERFIALFTYAEGDFGSFDRQHFVALGHGLAELHELSDRAKIPEVVRPVYDIQELVTRPISEIRPAIAGESEAAQLDEIAAVLGESMRELSRSSPQWGLLHGDYAGFNSHVDSHGRLTHFDFDWCGYGWRAYDLAVMLWSRRRICGSPQCWEQYEWFCKGYEAVRTLSETEKDSIPYLVLCRQLWLTAFNQNNVSREPHRPGNEHLVNAVKFMSEWLRELRSH
jgi:Ser/Thr protein kinase RdoA (MazF antagonist)